MKEETNIRDLQKLRSQTTSNNKQLTFLLKLKKTGFFGCSTEFKVKVKASVDEFEILKYQENNAKIELEQLYMKIKGSDIMTVSIYQNVLEDKNSFMIVYYDSKKKINYLRLYSDNRFECERYSFRLKELYSKDVPSLIHNYLIPADDEELITKNSITKDNPKMMYYSIRIVEEIIKLRKQFYYSKLFKHLSKVNIVNKDNHNDSDRI